MSGKIYHPIFKSIIRYQNHPSIIAIRRLNRESSFYFRHVTVDKIRKLDSRKATQAMDIPIKILKGNSEIADYICNFFN